MSTDLCIYQITGNPDTYNEVNFIIDNCKYKYKLSGEALLKHYNYNKIIILRPQSIKEDEKSLINKLIVEHQDKAEVLDIHAIGKYGNEKYISNVTNISLQLFIHMLKKAEEIICDISTGYNIYTYALMEAARFFATFKKLINNKQDNKQKLITRFAISEPVSKPNQQDPYNIFVEELRTHAFFSFPFTKNDINQFKLTSYLDTNDRNIKQYVGKNYKKSCQNIKKAIKNALKAYNAIRYNTPLVFQDLLKLDSESDISDLIKELNKFCNSIFSETKSKNDQIYSLMLKRDIYNLYLALAIYCLIIKNVNIKVESLDDLKQFIKIYNELGFDINSRFLEREIKEIEYYQGRIGNEEKYLDVIFRNNGCQNQHNQKTNNKHNKKGDIKRNFFAHAGFERTLVKVKRDNDKIIIKYDENEENRKKICDWLYDPS